MKFEIFVTVVAVAIAGFINCDEKLICDFSFGSQDWDIPKIFFNKTKTIAPGEKDLIVVIREPDGQMTSFVCVNVTSEKNNTKVSFAALQYRLKVHLEEAEDKETQVHIVAKHHGY